MQTHWFRRRASRGILRSFLVFAAASASLLGGAVSSYARAADDAAFPRATAESQGLSGEALSELSNVVRELVERDAIVAGSRSRTGSRSIFPRSIRTRRARSRSIS